MKSGSVARFKPDPEDGGGFVQELSKASVRGGMKGLKSVQGIRDRLRKAKEGVQHGALNMQ